MSSPSMNRKMLQASIIWGVLQLTCMRTCFTKDNTHTRSWCGSVSIYTYMIKYGAGVGDQIEG